MDLLNFLSIGAYVRVARSSRRSSKAAADFLICLPPFWPRCFASLHLKISLVPLATKPFSQPDSSLGHNTSVESFTPTTLLFFFYIVEKHDTYGRVEIAQPAERNLENFYNFGKIFKENCVTMNPEFLVQGTIHCK